MMRDNFLIFGGIFCLVILIIWCVRALELDYHSQDSRRITSDLEKWWRG